jgi:DNA modification methylase
MEYMPLTKINQKKSHSTTFVGNLSQPIHRWFRYSAGFSASWVNQTISEFAKNKKINVFDPFAGSGTVLIESEKLGMNSIGVESHPFVFKIARSKLFCTEDPDKFINFASLILENAKLNNDKPLEYPTLIQKCYTDESINQLDKLKREFYKKNKDEGIHQLTWLALVSILRECSTAGTAPWQYVLPNKRKRNPKNPFEAFEAKFNLMANDMLSYEKHFSETQILEEDMREKTSVSTNWGDLLITSPPYANNFDYADTTRLEMSFLGDIQNWGDLQEKVRKYLIHSCTQHVSSHVKETFKILENKLLEPIHDDIMEACEKLDKEKESHGGKKNYHTMIAFYFYDMAKTWKEIRRIMKKNSQICFVVGDSAPYGIHVPVEKWLGKLAISSGFNSFKFEKTRNRNMKWKNRKHRVPLQEGRLWVKG